jgi:hypothetical protein
MEHMALQAIHHQLTQEVLLILHQVKEERHIQAELLHKHLLHHHLLTGLLEEHIKQELLHQVKEEGHIQVELLPKHLLHHHLLTGLLEEHIKQALQPIHHQLPIKQELLHQVKEEGHIQAEVLHLPPNQVQVDNQLAKVHPLQLEKSTQVHLLS